MLLRLVAVVGIIYASKVGLEYIMRQSAREVEAYFAAKRELHRRFTDDQKIGNIWSWSWRGLQLRPQVAAFLDASSLWPHEAAADLADEWLGTFVQADSRWSKLHTGG